MQELVLRKDKQNRQSLEQAHQEKKRTQINKIRIEKGRGEITIDTREMQRIVRNYCEELYAKKFENLGKMDIFLEKM